jgi:hypothetical protein
MSHCGRLLQFVYLTTLSVASNNGSESVWKRNRGLNSISTISLFFLQKLRERARNLSALGLRGRDSKLRPPGYEADAINMRTRRSVAYRAGWHSGNSVYCYSEDFRFEPRSVQLLP